MLMEQTLEKMNQMKLSAMVEALQQQRRSNQYTDLGFEERLGLLVDEEWTAREHRKLTRRLRAAKLRDATASLENVDFKHRRRLDRSQVLALGSCGWIQDRHNLLITGPTGIGKSFLASAFVERACRRGFNATYVRMPRLLHQLAVGRGDGSYTRVLARLAKTDLLAIDDWLLAPLRDAERRDLIEVVEERSERSAILIASQLPVPDWHGVIGDPNQADAICDRLLHNAHRIELKGASMHPHAAARGYSRPAPDPIVAPAQSSREGSAGIRVRARNARLTQGTGPVETAAAVQMGMVAFGRLSLDHFHRCLQKPPQKTLPAFAQLHTGRRRFITIILERTKTGKPGL